MSGAEVVEKLALYAHQLFWVKELTVKYARERFQRFARGVKDSF